jgi:1,4-alpha-glucan branching enzyme
VLALNYTPLHNDDNLYLFHQGTHYHSFNMLGAHLGCEDGEEGVRFSVWAPNAKEARVIGDFNHWQGDKHKMKKSGKSGIWSLFIPGVEEGNLYKYEIKTDNNGINIKSDPYGFYSEVRPKTASVVYNLEGYNWRDEAWQKGNKKDSAYKKPMNIYEVHLGSWKQKEDGEFYTYRELAEELVEYVAEMGYTHIELMPITEYPYDGSWGYQITGYYSVTSRYGSPHDFMFFVDQCHQKGIGVILDWVPGHFCKDDHGLRYFDGKNTYEYEELRKAENVGWGTLNFDLGRPEVRSFLISNAVFWFEMYHIDGLRVDAVANMLYLDYGTKDDFCLLNKYGGNENLEAIEFMKIMNKAVFEYYPHALMIAEESTAWPLVTGPTYIGGLGYNYKWNMGWMNDTLRFMEMDPIHRKWNHNLLTFSFMYAFSENFILPLSHDEVVHGKKSLLDKMPGDYWKKFANLRAYFGYMIAHPGKKLLFMGGEFGQFIEWRYKESLEWFLLEHDQHKKLHHYVKTLNHFYKEENSLWERDHEAEGFQWIDPHDYSQSIVSFIRRGKTEKDFIVILVNFTPLVRENYKIGVPASGYYKEVLNSDEEIFGGSGQKNTNLIEAKKIPWHNQSYSIEIKVPPLAIIFFQCTSQGEEIE